MAGDAAWKCVNVGYKICFFFKGLEERKKLSHWFMKKESIQYIKNIKY